MATDSLTPPIEWRTRYRCAGASLEVTARSEELLSSVNRWLAPLSIEGQATDTEASYQLACHGVERAEESDVVTPLPEVWRGSSRGGRRSVHFGHQARRVQWVDGVGWLDFDFAARRGELYLVPEQSELARVFLFPLIGDLHNWLGGIALHAATLVRDNQAILVMAPSGTGKTTTSLALTDGGWQLMADDLSLVRQGAQGVEGLGVTRPCNIRRASLTYLPWLTELLDVFDACDEAELPLTRLAERAAMPCRWVPLRAIVCLASPNSMAHQMEAISPTDTLLHLSRETVQPVDGAQDRLAAKLFGRLAELSRTVPGYRLSAGPVVSTVGQAIDAVLDAPLKRRSA